MKQIILYVLKYSGVFWLIKKRSRRALRILCYHGISLDDEHEFRHKLFMDEKLFTHRMERLVRLGYPLLSLEDAVRGLASGTLPGNAVVVTFDDGWTGTFTKAVPILQKLNIPMTVYVTTYYADRKIPVLNMLVQYIFWKSSHDRIDFAKLGLAGIYDLGGEACDYFMNHLEQNFPVQDRLGLCRDLAVCLEVDLEAILERGIMLLASEDMIRENAGLDGIDIELHTHRHVFPVTSFEACQTEIEENRKLLESWTGQNTGHFCYPSGYYEDHQINWLKKMAVRSATTVKSGLNYPGSDLYQLDRFLDGQDVSDIEFEAELAGVTDLFRRIRRT